MGIFSWGICYRRYFSRGLLLRCILLKAFLQDAWELFSRCIFARTNKRLNNYIFISYENQNWKQKYCANFGWREYSKYKPLLDFAKFQLKKHNRAFHYNFEDSCNNVVLSFDTCMKRKRGYSNIFFILYI